MNGKTTKKLKSACVRIDKNGHPSFDKTLYKAMRRIFKTMPWHDKTNFLYTLNEVYKKDAPK